MKSLLARLEEKMLPEPNSGCWLWSGGRNGRGYGTLRVNSIQTSLAHRISFEFFRFAVPVGFELDHLCRVHACINPWHLEPVTHLENIRRGIRKFKTHCKRGHAFTPENTLISTWRGKYTLRACRTCRPMHWKAYRKRLRVGATTE